MAQQMLDPYGRNIRLATANKVAAATNAEAIKIKINVLIIIVDTGGIFLYLERFDVVQYKRVDPSN